MSKSYPLEIENVGEDVYILMSKGHHDPHEFMAAVRAQGYDWPLGLPTQNWVKTAPSRDVAYSCWYHLVPDGTRGAFPATYVHEAHGESRYEAVVKAGLPVPHMATRQGAHPSPETSQRDK